MPPVERFAVNSPYSDQWILPIGKLIINFGGVELHSYVWIERLSKDPVLNDIALDMPLSKRIQLIRALVERTNLSKKLRRQVCAAWANIEALTSLRNDIAHAPFVFGWHGAEDGKPHFAGPFRMKKLKGQRPRRVPLLQLNDLNRGIDQVVKVAEQLNDLLDRVTDEIKSDTAVQGA